MKIGLAKKETKKSWDLISLIFPICLMVHEKFLKAKVRQIQRKKKTVKLMGFFFFWNNEAILRYLGRKYGLLGRNDDEQTQVDILFGVAGDWGQSVSRLVYDSSKKEKFKEHLDKLRTDTLEPALKRYETFLGNKTYMVGDHITVVDFLIYEHLDVVSLMIENILKKYPKLEAYHDRIANLPAIANYRKSARFSEYPVNGDEAIWGGGKK